MSGATVGTKEKDCAMKGRVENKNQQAKDEMCLKTINDERFV